MNVTTHQHGDGQAVDVLAEPERRTHRCATTNDLADDRGDERLASSPPSFDRWIHCPRALWLALPAADDDPLDDEPIESTNGGPMPK